MTPYEKSPEFIRLEKLAELEKRILGSIEQAKDSNGPIGLSSVEKEDSSPVPEAIKKVIIIRAKHRLPVGVLNRGIDDGLPSLISHIARHKIMMTPGEALYSAIGKKDESIFDQVKNITLGEILSLIQNKAAVASTCSAKPMHLDDFDVPKHVKVMIKMRGMLPDELHKAASNSTDLRVSVKGFEFEFSNGLVVNHPKGFVKKNSSQIQSLIDDGAIIKVVQLLSSGRERTVFDKTASYDDTDRLYISLLTSRGENSEED